MNREVYKNYNQKLTRETVDFIKYTFLSNIILEYLTAYNFLFSVNKKKLRIFQSLYSQCVYHQMTQSNIDGLRRGVIFSVTWYVSQDDDIPCNTFSSVTLAVYLTDL